jgi:hypothetical protein
MFQGAESIRRALEVLDRDGGAKDRLVEAAIWYWSAMFDRDALPEDLRDHSYGIDRAILQEGSIAATVESMDDLAVEQAAMRLRDFAVEVASRIG